MRIDEIGTLRTNPKYEHPPMSSTKTNPDCIEGGPENACVKNDGREFSDVHCEYRGEEQQMVTPSGILSVKSECVSWEIGYKKGARNLFAIPLGKG
jgi:hypothetical protein